MMISYFHSYIDAIRDVLEIPYNFSTDSKDIRCIILRMAFTTLFIPLMHYSYYYIIGKSDMTLAIVIWILLFMWEAFPICMTNNATKPSNLLALLFDCTYAGLIWVFISLFFYKRYRNSINNPTLLLFGIANIVSMMVFFYEWYIYNREGTEHNWLVRLGDRFGVDNALSYVRINNPLK
jgi:hypothetical protein